LGGEGKKAPAKLLDEDPTLMVRRQEAWKSLELVCKAREQIEQFLFFFFFFSGNPGKKWTCHFFQEEIEQVGWSHYSDSNQ